MQSEEQLIQTVIEGCIGFGFDEEETLILVERELRMFRRDRAIIEKAYFHCLKQMRSKGGKGKKKLAKPEHEAWLREELAIHSGKKNIYQKIADALKSKHDYSVSSRTVRDRVKELGLLEDA